MSTNDVDYLFISVGGMCVLVNGRHKKAPVKGLGQDKFAVIGIEWLLRLLL